MTNKYLSIDDFSTFRGVTPTATTSPSLSQVNEYIELAEIEFEGRATDYSEQTDVVLSSRARKFQIGGGIYVEGGHLTNVSKVEVSDGNDFDPTWTELDTNPVSYIIDNALIGKIRINNYIMKRMYRATVDKGYSLVNMPVNIKYAVYVMTMKKIFENHLFDNNISDSVTRIIDVDVYKEISKGGNPFEGFGALDVIINDALTNIKGGMKTSIGW